MTATARAECRECSHIGALHGQSGCRQNGCRCAGFSDGSPRKPDPAERAFAGQAARLAVLERASVRHQWQIVGLAIATVILGVLAVLR